MALVRAFLAEIDVPRRDGVVPKVALCCKVADVVAPITAGVGVVSVDCGLGALWATQVGVISRSVIDPVSA